LAASGINATLGWLALSFIFLSAVVICFAVTALKHRIVLTGNGIQKYTAFHAPYCLLRSQIAGRRKVYRRNGCYFELVPHDRRLGALTLCPAAGLVPDEAFGAWLYSLPDVDELEPAESV
jgi:hypothetical protein